ncbi:hypothetical protein M885DRAFT_610398 [Pelagophyceae sp. CCMP2097]|nr:hypothetical protein M885DRAFT_610398 [Pelagophyceae sp. CCMP2097]|mmetsp:Transcript_31683/g.106727  ORF Transcript_31683/g.106727 Transcript_31683/m.106727 type:complete len:534 (-) Transcript_31683:77-1678(-)
MAPRGPAGGGKFRVKDLLVSLVVIGAILSVYNARAEAQSQIMETGKMRGECGRQLQELEARKVKEMSEATLTFEKAAEESLAAAKRPLEAEVARLTNDLSTATAGAVHLSQQLDGVQAQLDAANDARSAMERDVGRRVEEHAQTRVADRVGHEDTLELLRQAATQQLSLCRSDLGVAKAITATLPQKAAVLSLALAERDSARLDRDAARHETFELDKMLKTLHVDMADKKEIFDAARSLADLAHVVADAQHAAPTLPETHAEGRRAAPSEAPPAAPSAPAGAAAAAPVVSAAATGAAAAATEDADDADDDEIIAASAAVKKAKGEAAAAAADVAKLRAKQLRAEALQHPEDAPPDSTTEAGDDEAPGTDDAAAESPAGAAAASVNAGDDAPRVLQPDVEDVEQPTGHRRPYDAAAEPDDGEALLEGEQQALRGDDEVPADSPDEARDAYAAQEPADAPEGDAYAAEPLVDAPEEPHPGDDAPGPDIHGDPYESGAAAAAARNTDDAVASAVRGDDEVPPEAARPQDDEAPPAN